MSPPGEDLLRVEGVTHAFGASPVLVDATLGIAAGDFVGIVGPSGSGKTTLLKLMLGTLDPSSGSVRRRRGITVGYVPQVETVNWNFPVTVGEAVLMARSAGRRLPWAGAAERAEVSTVLGRLGLGGLAGRHIRALSGGQQQRVFIARALLARPDVLMLDEPTSGVDVTTRHEILHLLAELNAGGLAIVLTTHDLNGIAAHLPRLVCLNREIAAIGAPEDVLTPAVLERTYGAPMDVLHHGGMPLVVDHLEDHPTAAPLRRGR